MRKRIVPVMHERIPIARCCRKARPMMFLFVLLLLMGAPICAEDLVFPQGQILNLSSAEKRSYARLDFTVKVQLARTALLLLPD